MITIATIHCPIESDVRRNGRLARSIITDAARAGARLVHFPEASLSGYIGSEIRDWPGVDWAGLAEELAETAALAGRLGVWVVIGANHRLPAPLWPHNSLWIISDRGRVHGRYDKRFCSNTELTYWYTPGSQPLAFTVDGITFGCALCIEVAFPQVFEEYERMGVHAVLLSSYSDDPVHGLMAQAHAATNCVWISLATPTGARRLTSTLIGPDGSALGTSPPDQLATLLRTIDPDDPRFRIPLTVARPWRARARTGEIYAGRHADPPPAHEPSRSLQSMGR